MAAILDRPAALEAVRDWQLPRPVQQLQLAVVRADTVSWASCRPVWSTATTV